MKSHALHLASLLLCVLALCSCATSGPVPLPPPASLMVTPTYEQQIRACLFKSAQQPTHKSEDCSKP